MDLMLPVPYVTDKAMLTAIVAATNTANIKYNICIGKPAPCELQQHYSTTVIVLHARNTVLHYKQYK